MHSCHRHLLAFVVVFFGVLFLMPQQASGQKKVNLKKADQARGGTKPDGEKFQRLIGNVIFTQNNTTIFCDSAHFFRKRNSIEAFGHVHIVEGDSIDITGSRLQYDGDSKTARMRRNVVFTKLATATLYTDNLDFNRTKNQIYYFNGGKLIDSVNVLTSSTGYYSTRSNMASFKKDVKLVNPDYTMYSDSLRYNTSSKIIYFVTETKVINKDSSTFVYQEGIYNTTTRRTDVKQGVAESEDFVVVGERYDFDGIKNIAKVRGNVVMTSKKDKLVIYGQSYDHYKTQKIGKIYNQAYIAKIEEGQDTLFMRADTLISIDSDDPSKKRILAFNNVRIFRNDMQGKADSVEYRNADSTLVFYQNPVLWSGGNQMTADTISMLIQNNTVSKVFLTRNAFVISQDTLRNFNQIKGKRMTAELKNNQMSRVVVLGNGESIYYAVDEKTSTMMGMNKIICSHITIRFLDGRVNNLSFYVKPEAQFIPPHELKPDDQKLRGFNWLAKLKPVRNDVVPSSRTTSK